MNTFKYFLRNTALLFTALCFGILSFAQNPPDIQSGLIAYYAFNGGTEDASTYQNHGKMQGGVNLCEDRFGNQCSAMEFNGQDGFISVKSSPSLNLPSKGLSISAWIKISPDSPYADLQWISICCKSNQKIEDAHNPHYRFQSTKVTVSLNTDLTEEFRHEIDFNAWYFYTLNYDGKTVKTYLNAKQIWEFDYQKELLPNHLPLEIGRDVPGKVEYFAGKMDDVRLYNRPLTESEIRLLYHDKTDKNQEASYCPDVSTEPQNIEKIGRIDLQETIQVKSKQITVYLYDHKKEDGDIISLKFGDEWVLDKHKLENRKNRLKKNKSLKLTLKPYQEYLLISKAWNLGKIPPNTLTLEIYDGINPQPQMATINSSIGVSGAIRLKYVP